MAYAIAEPCLGTRDTACVDACPVDGIHPKKNTTRRRDELGRTLGCRVHWVVECTGFDRACVLG